jgi:hypothetical protein
VQPRYDDGRGRENRDSRNSKRSVVFSKNKAPPIVGLSANGIPGENAALPSTPKINLNGNS